MYTDRLIGIGTIWYDCVPFCYVYDGHVTPCLRRWLSVYANCKLFLRVATMENCQTQMHDSFAVNGGSIATKLDQ